jgi:hypothetical protein
MIAQSKNMAADLEAMIDEALAEPTISLVNGST